MVNFEGGVVDTPMEEWKPEEITAHLNHYKALRKELVDSGELVESQVLAPPDLAKIVTADGATAVVTDGPFQEFKEWVAGYQIVDVESEARAIEIAARISAVPRPGGVAIQQPIVGGLTTAEIANAFLVDEATMAQRISRAKRTIKSSGVLFRLPAPEERAARLRTVLHVLYLIFNDGYTSSSGRELHRAELSEEAIRLTRLVRRLLPDDAEVMGLLALMLLIDARRPARVDVAEELVPLAEQDRTLWDQAFIAEGVALLDSAVNKGAVGEYQLQAAIAAVHSRAAAAGDTDWQQILALYGLLEQMTGNPVVTLNRAVAAAMAEGPSAGLALLDTVDERLNGHYRLDAVRAHLLEMAGDTEAARRHYLVAAGRTTSLPEQRYLATRAARLGGQRGGGA